MKITFEKENNRWFAVIPDWNGSKDDLEMVFGADEMLEHLSNGIPTVTLYISTKPTNFDFELKFIRKATEFRNGAFYKIISENQEINQKQIYLCNVTVFVFGSLPRKLYVKVL